MHVYVNSRNTPTSLFLYFLTHQMYVAELPSYAANERLPAGVEIFVDEQENLQQGVPRQAVLLQQWVKVHGGFRTPTQVDGSPK